MSIISSGKQFLGGISRPLLTVWVAALLFLFLLSSGVAVPLSDIEASQGTFAGGDLQEQLAGMSDEQVRAILLEKLGDEAIEAPAAATIGGPGEVLNRLLDGVETVSSSTLDGVHQLLSALPKLLPDLYRVFVTL